MRSPIDRRPYDLRHAAVSLWLNSGVPATELARRAGHGATVLLKIYADLVAAGYRRQQPPYDAFWGARYAVIEDPDGNAVGIMSPVDPDRRSQPDFGET